MSNPCLNLIREGLLSVGYLGERLKLDVPTPADPSRKIGLVAYRDAPFDARTSAMAAFDGSVFQESDFPLFKQICAPILAHYYEDHVLFWKQGTDKPHFIERVAEGKIASFFQKHHDQLAPEAVYRAKVWGRMETSWQNDFVDIGLLPVIEQSAGEDLRSLLERAVTATKSSLGWGEAMSETDGCWLLKAVFWLLAAKILRDKGVPGFVPLDLRDLEAVYLKLAKHYNKHDPQRVQIDGSRRREALLIAADMIQSFGHCGSVTTESLAWVYESALITRETRKELGTHSTPTWLVDDIVARLRPWIEEMPVSGRQVFEPACGHGGFLISAMRLLSELLPEDQIDHRKTYLRQRLHGVELDHFAYEVAKLSLTLADVPNDNGWMLQNADMFTGDTLRAAVSRANIVLANPPFEKFEADRPEGAMHSRADETFRRIVEFLPVGGIFGVVMPQTILHSTQGKKLRQKLLDDYEISEITLFADKVFNYGEPETAVILGRRVGPGPKSANLLYRRVREEQVKLYKINLTPSSQVILPRSIFEHRDGSFLIPELLAVWSSLAHLPTLKDFVVGGQGFQHKGTNDRTLPSGAIRESDIALQGLSAGFAGWHEHQATHELPKETWLNLDPATISRTRHGIVVGQAQLLLNYAPVGRDAWRLKGLMDLKGHPVTSRFLAFRARSTGVSLTALWAVCNSPLANAYAYTHSSKRDVLTGSILKLPVFALDADILGPLETAVAAYFTAAKGSAKVDRKRETNLEEEVTQLGLGLPGDENASEHRIPEEDLKYLHWRIDAEVLRLYDLPAPMERRLLDLFTGVPRRGVPFVQREYFPEGFTELERLSDLLAITADWAKTNRRRVNLIRKDVKGKLSEDENRELQNLERLADARITLTDLQYPSVPDEIEKTVERLKREGRWVE